ncbi:DBH-like monooxygenase protein 1 [Rhopilema esculentum]|uniref:DBH-like monooxygenase protein 1 n=1 Tax=Rhopilema esculentum TaxID=499914 RepID=UPI0031D6B062
MAGKILPAFAAVLIFAASVLANLKDEYDHAAFLDPKESYKLYWSVKDADKSIHFAAEVKTTGWVAFGISAGLSGSMKGADIVVGWVDSKGKGHLKDYHGPSYGNGWPIEDKKQNYDYVGSSETNGVTVLKFKRKLVTCDKEDRDIPLGTSKVIYAHGPTDTFSKHQTNDRGARSINLLNYVKNVPPPKTAKYFDVISANVLVPSDKTTYWCSAYKFADLVQLTEKQHVVEIEPIIALKDRGVVHHMVLYICKNTFNDSHLNATGSCFDYRNMPPSITECAGISPMFAWAVGGVNFKFPDHVGWSIGAADSLRYFVLETHFDNPTQNNNLVVTNGLRLYYDKPRKYDAATLTVGTFTGRNLIIPPNREKWMITGSCTKTCTSYLKNANALNGDEVKFFASFPHAHTIGKGIWTKMVRNGKEVMEIIRDDNYDFDYQQTHLLRKEITFKAGDELINYCRYNSIGRKNATFGGESTVDEMCLNFIMYYPNVDLASCSSGYYGGMDSFKKKYGKQGKWGNYTYYHLHGVTWSEPMIDELENIYNRKVNSTIRVLCSGTNGTIKKVVVVNRPVITQALPPPKDVCTDSVGGAVSFQSTGVFALLISCVIASMLLVTIAQ